MEAKALLDLQKMFCCVMLANFVIMWVVAFLAAHYGPKTNASHGGKKKKKKSHKHKTKDNTDSRLKIHVDDFDTIPSGDFGDEMALDEEDRPVLVMAEDVASTKVEEKQPLTRDRTKWQPALKDDDDDIKTNEKGSVHEQTKSIETLQ